MSLIVQSLFSFSELSHWFDCQRVLGVLDGDEKTDDGSYVWEEKVENQKIKDDDGTILIWKVVGDSSLLPSLRRLIPTENIRRSSGTTIWWSWANRSIIQTDVKSSDYTQYVARTIKSGLSQRRKQSSRKRDTETTRQTTWTGFVNSLQKEERNITMQQQRAESSRERVQLRLFLFCCASILKRCLYI